MKLMDFINVKSDAEKECKKCGEKTLYTALVENNMICPVCGEYTRMNARERISSIADKKTFKELDKNVKGKNVISFPDYDDKLEKARKTSEENEAVVCGICEIDGLKSGIFVMDSYFMMGSMGTAVGEKITKLFEYATKKGLPVVGFTASGGARMQEGMFSLMQMAKVSGAVKRHSDKGLLYVTVLTDPTTGGVTASFAMEGDIIIAEPGALVGFAGARVIEQTTGQKLPKGFQRAEFLLEHGFIDMITERGNLRPTLVKVLKLHV
ncbi:MAG: acetyl-CoA carboxylase, carboxyltransferase subunit beta [Bacillota bacterium]|nr:acetyl-CoA carboxylase, carboxyltransferase subunit beta [Bacillota bacterium]